MRRIYLLCCITIATALAGGCSAIGYAYNNAPSFVVSELEDAFNLDDAQQVQLDLRLQKFFAWHRQHELPRYQQSLNAAAITIADGISAAEFLELSAEFRLAWRRLLTRAIDDLGDLALTLSPSQVDHFQQYLHEKSEDHREYLQMSAQQRTTFRVQRGLKRLQSWFGKLDERQQEKISLRLRQMPEFNPAWISYRKARQQALLDALRAAATEGLSRQQLKFILLDPASDYARDFEPSRTAYWRAYAQAIEDIGGLLRKSQLRHAVNRLQNYADTAAELVSDN